MAGDAQATAARTVDRLVTDLEGELEPLVARIVDRIRDDIPDFRRLPADALAGAVRGNVRRALTALRELRAPTPAELERSAAVGRERAEQGLTVDAVLHAYRISVTGVWSRFGELARERGADVGTVLAFSETLWLWADAVMDVVAVAHREIELARTREEQQRRDAFVFAALLGTSDHAELRRDAAALDVDPERAYVPFRARSAGGAPLSRRAGLGLAGDGLVAALDHDLIGLTATRPPAVDGVCVGVGPPARLAELPAAFALAGRAQATALAFGETGVFGLGDLSIRPAIVGDRVLGAAFVERYLGPLTELGRLGDELETTLRTWFACGMHVEDTARALHVHANTLRHRLRRFEETTGASLRRPGDLIELWWALEARRLDST